jgi:hypothetical protein
MGKKGREKIYEEAKGVADASLLEGQKLQAKAQADVEASKAAYESFEFKNPYANMENTYEDMTVNQQQAQFQAQQGQQQRANIMQSMRGAAGGSGIAGLAQAMANQGQLQTQQISASIGQQESQQQQLKARGAAGVQQMEREGEAMVQQAESGRISTLLGMDYGALAGANQGVQQGFANQQSAIAMNAQMKSANRAANMGLVGDILKTGASIAAAPVTGGTSLIGLAV